MSPIVTSSATLNSSSVTKDDVLTDADPWETWDEDGDYISCEVNGEGEAECEYVFPWGGD